MSLHNVLTQLAVVEAEITGVQRAHAYPPESVDEMPAFVNFIDEGNYGRFPIDLRTETGKRTIIHHIQAILYVCDGEADFVEAHSRATPYLESSLTKFEAEITLNSTCIQQLPLTYSLRELEYAGQGLWGLLFELEVTERTVATFTA